MKRLVLALVFTLSTQTAFAQVPTPLPSDPIVLLIQMNAQCLQQVSQLTKSVADETIAIEAINENIKSVWAEIGPVLLKYVLPAVGMFIAGLKIKG